MLCILTKGKDLHPLHDPGSIENKVLNGFNLLVTLNFNNGTDEDDGVGNPPYPEK